MPRSNPEIYGEIVNSLIDKIETEYTRKRTFWPPEAFHTQAVVEHARAGGSRIEMAYQRQTGRTTRMVLDIISNISRDPSHRPLIVTHTRRMRETIRAMLDHYGEQTGITIKHDQVRFAISGLKELDEVIRRESCGRQIDGIYIDNSVQDLISAG